MRNFFRFFQVEIFENKQQGVVYFIKPSYKLAKALQHKRHAATKIRLRFIFILILLVVRIFASYRTVQIR